MNGGVDSYEKGKAWRNDLGHCNGNLVHVLVKWNPLKPDLLW